MINIDALNDDEKLAALESIHKSIAESKEIQKKKITTNVELIVKALKKIESDLKQRYDETGQLIANLKNGEDGRDGKDGKDGKNGRDGRDGPVGPRGYDGLPGRNGIDGADGVSVTDAHIDFDGSLIISLSSGRVINVGEVVAADIAEKIKVITNGGGTSQGVLDAIASLQAQIDSIASGLEYQGTWNASTNVPTLTSSVGTAGYYYIVATAGSTNLNGVTDWQIGDWAVFNGSVWQKIDQTNLVTSVAGRTGAITLTTADIGGLGTIATQAASNVSITGGSIAGITDLAIADGGTGQSTAAAAITALTGTQTSGYYLRSNGTSASLSAISAGDVPTLNQNTTGTAAGLSATLATSSGGTGLTSFTADGVPYATSTSVLATSGLLKFQATNSALTVAATTTSNGYVGFTNSADGGTQGYIGDAKALITPGINSALAVRGEDAILFGIASTEGMRLNSTGLGIGKTAGSALDVKGTLRLSGSTSGYVGLAPAAAAGSTTYTLPSADGTANQALVTNGSGTLSWASTAVGTVTSVAASVPSFLSIAGSPITSSGTLAITLSGTALPTTSGGTGLTSFTSGGVVYASSTSALATGSALTWNGSTLLVGGNTRFGSGAVIPAFATASDASLANNASLRGTNAAGSTAFELIKLNASDQVAINGDGADAVLTSAATSQRWTVGGGEQMRLTSTGLGIGTSSPASKLTVSRGGSAGVVSNFTDGLAQGLALTTGTGYFGFYNPNYGAITFRDGGNAIENMRLTDSGNLGLGVTPNAWNTSFSAKAIELPGGSLWAFGTTAIEMAQNAYYNQSGTYTYITTATASDYYQFAGSHVWRTAPSGTAGTVVSFTQAMTLDASGNLGIGTSSPFASPKLTVFNSATITTGGDGGGNGVFIAASTGSASVGQLVVAGSDTAAIDKGGAIVFAGKWDTATNDIAQWAKIVGYKENATNNNYSGYLGFYTRANGGVATEKMRLDSSGNLGLGVTPSAWATLKGFDISSYGGVYGYTNQVGIVGNVYYGTDWTYKTTAPATYYTQTSGQHQWFRAPSGTAGTTATFTQAMTLDASGQLLVGATSAAGSERLNIVGGTGIRVNEDGVGTKILTIRSDFAGLGPAINVTTTDPLLFLTANTERARIDSSGNLLVGSSSSSPSSNVGVKTLPTGKVYCVSADSANTSESYGMYSTGAANYRFYVGWGGTVYATSTTITAISDQRLKENIRDLDEGLATVMALKPRKFDWKEGKGADIKNARGFIAQEFETVLPDMIETWRDPAPEGEEPYKAINANLIPTLVKAIQEQQAIINSLKARLDAANL